MIGPVRRNPSTVVILAGQASEGLLGAVGRSMNVSLVRAEEGEGIEPAMTALRRAAGISSPYVLVAADPLAAAAAEWEAMWEVTAAPRGSEAFELRAGEALAAWHANQFELPDYYLVLAPETSPDEQRPSFYLGPLRTVRSQRVAVVAATEPAEQAAGILTALASLRHGQWWPPLEEIIRTAREYYPGALSGSPGIREPRLLALGRGCRVRQATDARQRSGGAGMAELPHGSRPGGRPDLVPIAALGLLSFTLVTLLTMCVYIQAYTTLPLASPAAACRQVTAGWRWPSTASSSCRPSRLPGPGWAA